jgi:hypothetical protein
MQSKLSVANLKVRDLLQDLGVDGRIILKGILKFFDGMVLAGFIWRGGGGSGLL